MVSWAGVITPYLEDMQWNSRLDSQQGGAKKRKMRFEVEMKIETGTSPNLGLSSVTQSYLRENSL